MDRELAGWVELWQLGELDEPSRAKLVARLESDAAARQAFREAVRFEAMLHLEFPDNVIHIPRRRAAWYRRAAVPFLAVASLVLCAAISLTWRDEVVPAEVIAQDSPRKQTGKSKVFALIAATPVARVDSVSNLTLDPSSMPLDAGALLKPGKIHIRSGAVEITFFSGARVSLEGPCVFVLKSDFHATLLEGRLTAQVPQQAIGFTVHTPTGQLRDLGTSFAVHVDPGGVSDVHVLDGQVEAASRDGSTVVMLEGKQASRIAVGGLTPIAFTAKGWPVKPSLTRQIKLPESVHWTFETFAGDQSMDETRKHPLWMRQRNGDASVSSSRIHQGVRGKAISFDGMSQFAESSYRGISGSKPRSVSLWVKIPPDAPSEYPNGILSWGSHAQSRKWQVCWNNGDQGTVGALRVEFGDGYLVGTTDLRDGRWHHLCAVFLGISAADPAADVKLYVDGRLETFSGRRSQLIRTDTDSAQSTAVTLGRWLGYWPDKEPFLFTGMMDEVQIFGDALSPAQVASLALPATE